MEKEQKSGFGIVGIIIIIAAVAVLGGGFLYLRELQRLKNITAPPSILETQTKSVTEQNSGEAPLHKQKSVMQYVGFEPSSPAPHITILSPKKGDVWEIGSKQSVRWSQEGDFKSLLYRWTGVILECGTWGAEYKVIASFDKGITEVPTSFDWIIPEDTLNRSCNIKIEYNTSDSMDFGGMSAPEIGYWSTGEQFMIKTPGSGKPNIIILAPKGGEVLKIGQSYTIRWRRERLSKGVNIALYRGDESLGIIGGGPFSPLVGMLYTWTVDHPPRSREKEYLTPGENYSIRIATNDLSTGGPPPEADARSEKFIIAQ